MGYRKSQVNKLLAANRAVESAKKSGDKTAAKRAEAVFDRALMNASDDERAVYVVRKNHGA